MTIRFNATSLELTAELEKYTQSKVGRISRRIPRGVRAAAVCEVNLNQAVRRGTKVKVSTCSVTLSLGSEQFIAEETTQHMHAAVDIVVVQIERQLRDYARGRRGGFLRRRQRSE